MMLISLKCVHWEIRGSHRVLPPLTELSWTLGPYPTTPVLAYVHNRLTWLCPSLRRDLIDHCNILVLSLFSGGRTINIMNVYSDDQHTAINLLAERAPTLPACVLMTAGDFNCHSCEWDPSVPRYRSVLPVHQP